MRADRGLGLAARNAALVARRLKGLVMGALLPAAVVELPASRDKVFPEMRQPLWLDGLGYFLVGDASGVYGVLRTGGDVLWHLEPRRTFWGYAVDANDLYLQDEHVLLKYDMSSVVDGGVRIAPDVAVNIATGDRMDLRGGEADLDSLYESEPPGRMFYSAPVVMKHVGDDDIAVFVLDSTGTMYGFDKTLTDYTSAAHGRADSPSLVLSDDDDTSRLYYSSGEKVIGLDPASDTFRQVTTLSPPKGPTLWLAALQARSRAQQPARMSLCVTTFAGPPAGIVFAKTMDPAGAGTLRLVHLAPPWPQFVDGNLRPGPLQPLPSMTGGSPLVRDGVPARILSPPYLLAENGVAFAYAIVDAPGDDARYFAGYKLDAACDPEPWQDAWANAQAALAPAQALAAQLDALVQNAPSLSESWEED